MAEDPKNIPEWPEYLIQEVDGGFFAWTTRDGIQARTALAQTPRAAFTGLLEVVPRVTRFGMIPRSLAEQLEIGEAREKEIEENGITIKLSVADLKIIADALCVDLDRMENLDYKKLTQKRRKEWVGYLTLVRDVYHSILHACPDFEDYQGFAQKSPCPSWLRLPNMVDIVDESGLPSR